MNLRFVRKIKYGIEPSKLIKHEGRALDFVNKTAVEVQALGVQVVAASVAGVRLFGDAVFECASIVLRERNTMRRKVQHKVRFDFTVTEVDKEEGSEKIGSILLLDHGLVVLNCAVHAGKWVNILKLHGLLALLVLVDVKKMTLRKNPSCRVGVSDIAEVRHVSAQDQWRLGETPHSEVGETLRW